MHTDSQTDMDTIRWKRWRR